MEYIIGGCLGKPDIIIEKALNFFKKRYSESCEFEGLVDGNFFIGIIKDKKNGVVKRNTFFFENNKIFKSLYYPSIPEIIRKGDDNLDNSNILKKLYNDFIFIFYQENIGIKVFKDIFAREKIYYSIKPPFLFSTSFKFLISTLENKKINPSALVRYLGTGLNIGEETVIYNIKRLDVGEFLYINNNNIYIYKDWNFGKNFFEVPKHNVKDINFWVNYIYNTFKEIVNFPTTTPILSMMSGGLDSTVITSIFAKEFDIPIEALTIKVPNYNEEEVEKAIEIAEYIGIPHYIKEIKIHNLNDLESSYSKIFNILEEPMGGTAYFSRYFAFEEAKKLKRENIMLGEGAGEVMSYLRHNVLNNFKYLNKIFYIPLKLRSSLNNLLNNFYYPSFKITQFIKNKNLLNSIDILLNSNFLQSKSEIQVFLSSVQFCNLNDAFRITHHKLDFDTYTAANVKKFQEYPYNDCNKFGYHLLNLSPNGDPLISHGLASLYGLKLYCPYISDISFKKLLPLPPYIKMTGEGYRTRYKWIVRAIAMRKNLLPKNYFSWKPKYGLRQEFFNEDSFQAVKSYAIHIIESLDSNQLIDLNPFLNFFNQSTLQRITKHSTEYMKFNIWLGFLGWLATI